ncbi:ABC transporter substrate-binding protein [Euzebya pacifica]|uniref:ABC transporter substrate-binding protein n=1 Tax=Euzebya pacifica TaxID=1608957 RepID=UPI0030FC16D7
MSAIRTLRILSAVVLLGLLLNACSSTDADTAATDTTDAGTAATDTTDEDDGESVETQTSEESSNTEESAGDTPEEFVELKVASTASAASLPLFVATSAGLFEDEGLDVDLQVLGGGPAVATALASGEAQVGVSSVNVLLQTISSGTPLIGFLTVATSDATSAFSDTSFSITATDESIASPADLVGRTVGVPGGPGFQIYVQRAVEAAGGDPDALEFVTAGEQSDLMASLAVGDLDAVALSDPAGCDAVSNIDGAFELLRGGGYIASRVGGITTAEFADANPDVVMSVTRALVRADHLIRTDSQQAAEIGTQWIPGTTVDSLLCAIENGGWDPRVSDFVEESWGVQNDILIGDDRIVEAVAYEDGFDPSFVQEVEEQHPELFDDLPAIP